MSSSHINRVTLVRSTAMPCSRLRAALILRARKTPADSVTQLRCHAWCGAVGAVGLGLNLTHRRHQLMLSKLSIARTADPLETPAMNAWRDTPATWQAIVIGNPTAFRSSTNR